MTPIGRRWRNVSDAVEDAGYTPVREDEGRTSRRDGRRTERGGRPTAADAMLMRNGLEDVADALRVSEATSGRSDRTASGRSATVP